MNFEHTYAIEKSPKPAMDWKTYSQLIMGKWSNLLNQNSPISEETVQRFLEEHPSMVPGAFNIVGPESGHYPWLCGLISQPILPSFDHHKPDFMWLSQNSDTVEPVLIEIEAPGKQWWTDSGVPTSNLRQALDQISEWKAWFDVPHNVLEFKDVYGLSRDEWRKRRFKPAYLLIYGRSQEANAKPNLTAKRSHLAPEDVRIRTYDHLQPNPKAAQYVCMKIKNDTGNYVFSAIHVPATMTWSPSLAEDRSLLENFDKAIESNEQILQERKEFLIRRLPYWNDWAKKPDKGLINSGDEE